jgi:peptide deformylase
VLLKILQTGDPVLRKMARPLSREEILSSDIQELIEWMRETMRDAPGVGLAAPQIGVPLQLVVIEDQQEFIDKLPAGHAEARGRTAVPFHVVINPALVADGAEEAEFNEGCLSIAGFTAVVPRALQVHVECLNENAEPVVIGAEGWYARILQHEIDHLHGRLYIDRMYPRTFSTLDNHTRHCR